MVGWWEWGGDLQMGERLKGDRRLTFIDQRFGEIFKDEPGFGLFFLERISAGLSWRFWSIILVFDLFFLAHSVSLSWVREAGLVRSSSLPTGGVSRILERKGVIFLRILEVPWKILPPKKRQTPELIFFSAVQCLQPDCFEIYFHFTLRGVIFPFDYGPFLFDLRGGPHDLLNLLGGHPHLKLIGIRGRGSSRSRLGCSGRRRGYRLGSNHCRRSRRGGRRWWRACSRCSQKPSKKRIPTSNQQFH